MTREGAPTTPHLATRPHGTARALGSRRRAGALHLVTNDLLSGGEGEDRWQGRGEGSLGNEADRGNTPPRPAAPAADLDHDLTPVGVIREGGDTAGGVHGRQGGPGQGKEANTGGKYGPRMLAAPDAVLGPPLPTGTPTCLCTSGPAGTTTVGRPSTMESPSPLVDGGESGPAGQTRRDCATYRRHGDELTCFQGRRV